MIPRELTSILSGHLHKGKALVIIGARQTGKTTLLRELVRDHEHTLWLNADDMDKRNLLQTLTIARLQSLFGGYELS